MNHPKPARLTAADFHPEVMKLFDQYVHGFIDRRGFLDGSARYAAMDAGTPGDEAVCAICRESGNTPERCTATHCHHYEPEGATE